LDLSGIYLIPAQLSTFLTQGFNGLSVGNGCYERVAITTTISTFCQSDRFDLHPYGLANVER